MSRQLKYSNTQAAEKLVKVEKKLVEALKTIKELASENGKLTKKVRIEAEKVENLKAIVAKGKKKTTKKKSK